jgi:hypothetical protein
LTASVLVIGAIRRFDAAMVLDPTSETKRLNVGEV